MLIHNLLPCTRRFCNRSDADDDINDGKNRHGDVENEIDIIAADDLEKQVTFYEVKRQRKELDMKVLKDKVQHFKEVTGQYDTYNVSLTGLCMEDM